VPVRRLRSADGAAEACVGGFARFFSFSFPLPFVGLQRRGMLYSTARSLEAGNGFFTNDIKGSLISPSVFDLDVMDMIIMILFR
jgi:hypothetical protein